MEQQGAITVTVVNEDERDNCLRGRCVAVRCDGERVLAISTDTVGRRVEDLREHERPRATQSTDYTCSFCPTSEVVARFADDWNICRSCMDDLMDEVEGWVDENAHEVLGEAL